MLLNLVLLAIAPSQGGHAALHPADAGFFLEIPDLEALTRAYADAPLVQFISDPEIEAFAARIAGRDPEGYRLDEQILSGIEAALMEAEPAFAEAFDLLFEARAASLSVTLARETPGEAGAGAGWNIGAVSLLAAIEFSSAEAASAAAAALGGSFGASETDTPPQLALDLMGVKVPIWLHTSAATMFVGVGSASREGLAQRLESPEGSLGFDPVFRDGRGRFAVEGGVRVYECFIRMQELSRAVAESGLRLDLAAQAAVATGIEAFFPAGFYESHQQTRLVGSRFVKEKFVRDVSDRAGLFDALGGSAISSSSLELLPANAVGAWVTSLDPQVLGGQIRQLASLATGISVEAFQAQMQEDYGFDPLSDLVDSLGTSFAVYSLPITGLTIPKVHLALDLADPAAFTRGIEGLGRLINELSDGEIGMRQRPYRNLPIYTFSPRQNIGDLAGSMGAPSGFVTLVPNVIESEIALTLMDGRVIVGLGDQGVKREIKRLLLQEDSDPHPLAAGGLRLPDDATSVGFIDWGAIHKGLYSTVRAFLPLIAQAAENLAFVPQIAPAAENLPFVLSHLPDAEAFTRHWGPTLSWDRRVPGGTYTRQESSFGPETPLALVVGGGAAARYFSRQDRALVPQPLPPPVEIQPRSAREPTLAPAERRDDPHSQVRDLLLEVKLALVVYRTDQGQYPAALTDLFAATTRFPQGFLERGTSLDDAWGSALRYEVGAQGASFLLWSIGPDGVDERGAGDDLSMR